jgi:hypothetical protein
VSTNAPVGSAPIGPNRLRSAQVLCRRPDSEEPRSGHPPPCSNLRRGGRRASSPRPPAPQLGDRWPCHFPIPHEQRVSEGLADRRQISIFGRLSGVTGSNADYCLIGPTLGLSAQRPTGQPSRRPGTKPQITQGGGTGRGRSAHCFRPRSGLSREHPQDVLRWRSWQPIRRR